MEGIKDQSGRSAAGDSDSAPAEGAATRRRDFLRKAAYTTPTLIAMGLMLPGSDAEAQCPDPFGCPPSLNP